MVSTTQNSSLINHFHEEFELNKNYFFTPLMSLSLKEIESNLGPVKFESQELISLFENPVESSIIPSSAYKNRIKRTNTGIELSVKLAKKIPFKKPFYLNEKPLNFHSTQLNSFVPIKDNVELIYYNNEKDFALELIPLDSQQQILIVKSPFKSTASFYNLFNSLKYKYEQISPEDNISIPIINVDIKSDYSEIVNRQAYIQKRPILLDEITENLQFVLDNQGAVIKNEVFISGKYSCKFDQPKNLLIDDSFAVFLKQKESTMPYFAGYFHDTKFLSKFNMEKVQTTNNAIVQSFN